MLPMLCGEDESKERPVRTVGRCSLRLALLGRRGGVASRNVLNGVGKSRHRKGGCSGGQAKDSSTAR